MIKRASLTASVLIISLVLSSCFTFNKGRECPVITEDTPWYEARELTFGCEYDDIHFNNNWAESNLIGMIPAWKTYMTSIFMMKPAA